MEKFRPAVASTWKPTNAVPAALALALIAVPAMAIAANPYDVSTRPITYEPLPLSGGQVTTLTTTSTDDGSADVGLPFPVRFFDVDYQEASVGTNGLVTFGPRSTASCTSGESHCANAYSNTAIPSTSTPNRLIAAWWDDLNCTQGAITKQVLGQAPQRELVIQWGSGCYRTSSTNVVNMQLWLREGSSNIEIRYGTAAGGSSHSASVGIMSPVPSGAVEGYRGLNCTPNCTGDQWPTNSAIVFSQGADLAVASVTAPEIAYSGMSIDVVAKVQNLGGLASQAYSLRFLVSPTPSISTGSREVGRLEGLALLQAGASFVSNATVSLPADLAPGAWYVLAEVDPDKQIPDNDRANNLRSSGPMEVGPPAPDLSVSDLRAPLQIAPGSDFSIEWTARNLGNLGGVDVPYAVVVSGSDYVGGTSRRLLEGTISVDAFSLEDVIDLVHLPADVPTGIAYVGVVIDPDLRLYELDKLNNTGISPPVRIGSTSLQVINPGLPAATLGTAWCTRLEAVGGDGIFAWSVTPGSTLPPGLALAEEPQGARAAGRPFSTLLCGHPYALGTFSFSLDVRSAGLSASGDFVLDVVPSGIPLTISTHALPAAGFGRSYTTLLGAIGGATPYSWTITTGKLPAGLGLRADGVIAGSPLEDGFFPLTVRVVDAGGQAMEQALDLIVTSPSRLTCVTGSLPARELGEPLDERLVAAGGTKPYKWTSGETQRLASAVGEVAVSLGAAPPPGLSLAADGKVTGAPTQAGLYLWTVKVADDARASESCAILFDVPVSQGMTVSTQALADAFVGSPYRAQLVASGGVGALRWSLFPGSRLPAGLVLEPSGLISGTPTLSQLDGEAARNFAFLVEVRDEGNRRGLGATSILLNAELPESSRSPASSGNTSGCGAGVGGPSLLALAGLGLRLVALRRRR
ncbi:putative Ig domain-containing protein [Vulgatibacter incomptus]|uniref:Endonuclease/exonuclease/phosphatase family protein n=1 Tax=Vulgatibacter incomptus TaxID=1391653 RepID=A0A0K1PJI6_9BACT|nr:putative Ig domain-containing protein [Vulgatibacter incomptus]AKU93254.1 Endonuclease/exonuclease/phosphatase family protein [Vulgatibacter incomptus]